MIVNKFKITTLIAITVFTLNSCNTSNTTTQSDNETPIDTHAARNSLDWNGVYSGKLPCADCEAIETELALNEDLTYVLTSKYIGKEKLISDTLKGKFVWKGNSVKLEGIPKNSRPEMFKVEENQIRHLDMEGKTIKGDLEENYIMKKNGNINVEDKKWQLVELNGRKIDGTPETHYLIFHSKMGRLESKANCNVMSKEYKIKNELQIEIKPGTSTLMACPDNLEQEFSKVLLKIDNLTTDGKSLSLNKARMAPLAKFKLVEK